MGCGPKVKGHCRGQHYWGIFQGMKADIIADFTRTTFLSSMLLVIYACSDLITSGSFIPYESLIPNWVFGLFPHFNYLRMKYILNHRINKSKSSWFLYREPTWYIAYMPYRLKLIWLRVRPAYSPG